MTWPAHGTPVADAPPRPRGLEAVTGGDGDIRRRRSLLPVLVPTVAFALRAAAGLGRPAWLDEAYTVSATRDPIPSFVAARGSMALYYAATWVWGHAGTGLTWIRLPSFVAMVAAVALTAALVARQHDRATGALAAAVVGLNPLVIVYAAEARPYAMVCLAVVVAYAALDRGIERPDERAPWMVHRVACVVAVLLHGVAGLAIIAQGMLILAARPPAPVRRRALAGIGLGIAVTVVTVLVGAGSSGGWIPPMAADQAFDLVTAVGFRLPLGPAAAVAVVALPLAVASGRLVRDARAEPDPLARTRLLMPVAWGPATLGLVLAVSVLQPVYLSRYAIPAAFGIAITFVVAARRYDRHSGRSVPLGTAVVVALAALGCLGTLSQSGPPWPEAAAIVRDAARPGDVAVFPTTDAKLPFDVAWNEAGTGVDLATIDPNDRVGSVQRVNQVPSVDDLVDGIDGAPRVWVVVQRYAHVDSPDLLGDPRIRADYRVDDRWDLDAGISVVLLERR